LDYKVTIPFSVPSQHHFSIHNGVYRAHTSFFGDVYYNHRAVVAM